MKVFILTEGGENIGFGHITRCISLFSAFQEKGLTPELIINGDETLKSLLVEKKYKIFNWLQHKEKIFVDIKDADIVIVDSYLAGAEFYRKISQMVKVPVYIDDNIRIDYPRGIVVNPTISAEKLNYKNREGTIYLLGSHYMPLRKEFWRVPEKELREDIISIMISFGGEDDKNMTPKILRFLNQNYHEFIKKVIIGSSFRNTKEIEDLKDERTNLVYYPGANTMKELMLGCDIAISAGGQTLYELARIGVPTIALAVTENQLNNIKGWRERGFIEYVGWWKDADVVQNLKDKLNILMPKEVRIRKHLVGKKNICGLGAVKIIAESLKYYKKN